MTRILTSIRRPRTIAGIMLPVIPTLCWFALWASINSGPGDIDLAQITSGWTGAFNGVRATFPLVVLAIWLLHLALRPETRLREPTVPEWLWFLYAVVCLTASIGVKDWFMWGYWGLAFLATLGAAEMYLADCGGEVAGAVSLNRLSWVLAAVILAMIVYVGRGHLDYSVNVQLRRVAGMPMVRSSGISRFAGAVAIVACAAIWRRRGWTRVASLAIFAGCAWLVWILQSRGSLVSTVAGVAVAMCLLGGRARRFGFVVLILMAGAAGLQFISHSTLHFTWEFATRHDPHLEQMHGRIDIYHDAWEAILRSPIIGYGPQADRRIILWNAQNGVLYSILCGGFIGGAAWTLGLLIALMYLARAVWRRDIVPAENSLIFAQIAGLMVFFTLRTIPENTAALFSVDLLLQLPAMIFLGTLIRASNLRNAGLGMEPVPVTQDAAPVGLDVRAYR